MPASRTRDVGGSQDTDQFCASVIAALQHQQFPTDLGPRLTMTYTVEPEILTQFGTEVLTALRCPDADAHLLSDSLVTAELWGHSSHGMLRLPWYVERLRSGVMTAVDPE